MPDESLPARHEVAAYLDRSVDLEPTKGAEVLLDGIAAELTALDRRPGEIVLIALANGMPLLRCFFGALLAGWVPAILPAGTPMHRSRLIADELGARTLIMPAEAVTPGQAEWRRVGPVCLVTRPGVTPTHHGAGDVILLTSGTSGIASGCLHRVSSLLRNAGRHADAVGLRRGDTMLVNLPLSFSYALVAQTLAGLRVGARLVITGPPFTPATYHSTLRDHGVTSSSITPFMARGLASGDWTAPASLRMLTVGGDCLDPAVAGALLDRAPELYLTYGLTEAGPRVSTLAAHREPPSRLTTVGRPLAGVQVALRDVGPDGVGELMVTSDTVLRRKVGVEEGRVGDCLVGPDQIATGDLFRIDDGYLHFRGRLSDFLVNGGAKVSLASVRRIANSLPNVITSRTRVYRTEDGVRFDLDLFLEEVSSEAAELVRRSLRQQLVRTEWPSSIRTLSVRDMGHK